MKRLILFFIWVICGVSAYYLLKYHLQSAGIVVGFIGLVCLIFAIEKPKNKW